MHQANSAKHEEEVYWTKLESPTLKRDKTLKELVNRGTSYITTGFIRKS